MTVLGSRLLETQKRVSESAEALALRQAGESSIIGCLAVAVTASLNDVLRWVYWWHSTEALPEDVQERCWTVLREQVAWFERSPSGWLLKETAVIAVGLASAPGPVRERHRADFIGLRDHIEKLRKANDPAAGQLADLRKADWVVG